MPRQLVIVESPVKAEALARHLGPDFVVCATRGPVRALARDPEPVDVTRGFAAQYEIPAARRRVVAELRRAAGAADDTVTLAPDPDGEGETLCWHLAELLAGPRRRFERVRLHELSPAGFERAFRAPCEIDRPLVEAERARQILDHLVEQPLGQLVRRALGARALGRLEAVALGMVCERERARRRSATEPRFAVELRLDGGSPPAIVATLAVAESGPRGHDEAERLVPQLEAARFRVVSCLERSLRRPPPLPFSTATLLGEASRVLSFGVRKTMKIAQRLYEPVSLGAGAVAGAGPAGLVTCVRTRSTQASPAAVAAARAHIARRFGAAFLPPSEDLPAPPHGCVSRGEAIRPCDLARTPDTLRSSLGPDELALYGLIFERFLASQMTGAVYQETLAQIEAQAPSAGSAPIRLEVRGVERLSPGFLSACADPAADSVRPLPPLATGQELRLQDAGARRRHDDPPPRFSEGGLVEELDRNGIRRPASLVFVLLSLLAHGYVTRAKGELRPTPLGLAVDELLAARLPELASVSRATATEAALDALAEGRGTLLGTLGALWEGFATLPTANTAREAPPGARLRPPTAPAARPGRGLSCPRCHEGRVVERRAEGRLFFGCSRYPACRFTSSHPPLAQSCPECGAPCLFEKDTKRAGRIAFCANPACRYERGGLPTPG